MRVVEGDMWSVYEKVDLFLITTDSVVIDGKLVMGAGIAGEAARRFPILKVIFGKMIPESEGVYGLLVQNGWPSRSIGAFQTKTNWGLPSSLAIIERSTQDLIRWCDRHPGAEVALPFPGIGMGGLKREDVLPIIRALPSEVTVWVKG